MGDSGVNDVEEHPETNNFLPCIFVINEMIYCSDENVLKQQMKKLETRF